MGTLLDPLPTEEQEFQYGAVTLTLTVGARREGENECQNVQPQCFVPCIIARMVIRNLFHI
jgi:hypothetical protein